MTPQEREQAAMAEIGKVLEAHQCILIVNTVPNQEFRLSDGTIVLGTRYVVAVQAQSAPELLDGPGETGLRSDP